MGGGSYISLAIVVSGWRRRQGRGGGTSVFMGRELGGRGEPGERKGNGCSRKGRLGREEEEGKRNVSVKGVFLDDKGEELEMTRRG